MRVDAKQPRSRRRPSRNVRIFAAVSVALLFIACLVFLITHGIVDDLRRLGSFGDRVPLSRIRFCRCMPDADVEFVRADGVSIAGSLYGTSRGGSRPWIVLVHGNTPHGRKLGIYRVLAGGLARRGHRVLTLDQSGFGESGDPFEPGTVAALDPRLDLVAALDYLESQHRPGAVYLVGHSGGASPVLRVGIGDPRVAGLVAVGPPRRNRERLENPDDRAYFWNRARRFRQSVAGREFPDWFTEQAWLELRLQDDMEHHLGYFSAPDHKPLLLIDGERESAQDRDYLRAYFESIAEPKDYVTLGESDHYCNTRSLAGGRVIVYDRQVVAKAIDLIANWIAAH